MRRTRPRSLSKRISAISCAGLAALGLWAGCSDGPSMVGGGGATGVVGITGVALRADGKPASGVEVVLRSKGFVKALSPNAVAEPGAPAATMARDSADGITDGEGRFRFDGIDTGEYSLEVRVGAGAAEPPAGAWNAFHADGSRRVVELPARKLEALGGLEGVLTGAGGAASGGYVQILGLDRLARCDSLGRFAFSDLPAGSFRLRAVPVAGGGLPTLTGEVKVASGETGNLGNLVVTSGSLMLDGFESDSLRAVTAVEPSPAIWSMARPPEDPAPAIFIGDTHDGTRGLRAAFSSDSSSLHFHPSLRSPEKWFPLHNYLTPSGVWTPNTYDRLRFWIRIPSGLASVNPGGKNLEVGVYIRRSDGDSSTSTDGGGLFHHQFNIPATGEWHQVILDTHPGQESGTDGDVDPGDHLHPTGEPGYNYFDLATGFYLRFSGLASGPAEVRVDGFEVFHAGAGEDAARVYGLHGVYVPASKGILVGWRRHKDETGAHEVKYAFRSVLETGWGAALSAPGGTIEPLSTGGYNGMEWSSTAIDVTGRTHIFVAIRPVGGQGFREIEIPLSP